MSAIGPWSLKKWALLILPSNSVSLLNYVVTFFKWFGNLKKKKIYTWKYRPKSIKITHFPDPFQLSTTTTTKKNSWIIVWETQWPPWTTFLEALTTIATIGIGPFALLSLRSWKCLLFPKYQLTTVIWYFSPMKE